MSDAYTSLIERISQSAKLSLEDVERKIEGKRAKLSGLISKEGAAQIVAAELGISLDNERQKIGELVEGARRARTIGKITSIFPVRSFEKNGRSGKIGSFLLGDESSNVRVVLWDMHHIALIEENKLKVGDIIEVSNGAVRNGELHLSAFSDLKQSSEKLGEVKTSRVASVGTLKDAKAGALMQVRAVVVQMFDPKYFDGKDGSKKALVNLVIDDGHETIRAVIGSERLISAGFSEEEIFSPELFNAKKQEILGDERLFSGNFRVNTYFNRLEMSIDSISKVNVDSLIKELEQKNKAQGI